MGRQRHGALYPLFSGFRHQNLRYFGAPSTLVPLPQKGERGEV